jgi:transcriptional regulator with GAF, ATPase, and Fis domain
MVVPESTEVTPLASAGRDEGYTDQVRVRWDLSPRALGPAGRAIKMGKPQLMRVDEPDFAPWRDEATKRGFQVVCALPLTQGETVRGVIALYSGNPADFGPETFDILEIFAGQCAMVLVNASLYEEARRTIQELWQANEELKKGQGRSV